MRRALLQNETSFTSGKGYFTQIKETHLLIHSSFSGGIASLSSSKVHEQIGVTLRAAC